LSILSEFTAGLNPRQAEAVETIDGPVLVLAGAGSGKTRVITRRVAALVASGIATPGQVLAVTFTNKAAAEMRTRIAELIGDLAKEVVISTFHSYCLRVLRTHIENIGYRRNFTIAGEGDVRVFLRRIVDDIATEQQRFSPAEFQSAISMHKNAATGGRSFTPRPIETESQEKYDEVLPEVIERYQSALRAANSLDFDDLLAETLRLWREHPGVLRECQQEFRFVMVDEYQDTNRVQFELVRNLVDAHKNLCVVGDDDQSIYRWRGADPRTILDFDRHFPAARVITLDQNYRSVNTVLKAANAVIKNNTERRDKALWSDKGDGREIDWIVVEDDEAEARECVNWLRHIQEKTGARYRDFAILYRSNLQSKNIEISFRQAGIPYTVVGGQQFFERAEVKDVLCYLRILANPRDESAFLRVVNMPRRGIGDSTLHAVHELCRSQKLSLGKALAEALRRGDTPPQAKQGIRTFLDLLTTFRERFKQPGASIKAIVEDLVLAIDYRSELERGAKNREQAHARWQNVELVLTAIGEYEAKAEKPSLMNFLDESHLNADGERFTKSQKRGDGATLMTIHSAKGLEYPFVFITGCEDGLIPHDKSVKEGGLEEERRLFYVALTRAQRHITLFEALRRRSGERDRPTKTSRFLKEIPPELLRSRPLAMRDMMEAAEPPKKPAPKKRKPRVKR